MHMHFPKGFLAAFSNFWNRIFPSRVRIYALISKLYRMIIRKRYILSIENIGRIVCRFFFSFRALELENHILF